jgi:hypothetical protein
MQLLREYAPQLVGGAAFPQTIGLLATQMIVVASKIPGRIGAE